MRISRTLVVLVAVLVLSVVRTTTAGYTGTVLYKLTTPSDYPALFNQFDAFGGQFVATATGGGAVHALVWQQNGNVVDLNPSGLANSSAKGTSGTQQVGDGSPTAANYHALLWTGTAASAIDLNPTNYSSSNALGTNGTQQVGYGAGTPTGGSTHALLWTGTADSAIDLNPSGFTYSEATAADGSHQVGYGYIGSFAPPWHALLWSGTSDSAVDLNPNGYFDSFAYGTGGSEQVGYGDESPGSSEHALLWFGTADSAVDLSPLGYENSLANGTDGTQQVGAAALHLGSYQAFLWTGTASSGINLQAILPAGGVWNSSQAYSIDAAGNIYGYAQGTFNNITGSYAVMWSLSPVPEPPSIALGFMAVFIVLAVYFRGEYHSRSVAWSNPQN